MINNERKHEPALGACECGHPALTLCGASRFPWNMACALTRSALRRFFLENYETAHPEHGCCLQAALIGRHVIKMIGASRGLCIPVLLAGGSAEFRITPPEQDDGKTPNCFSFTFEETEQNVIKSVAKIMMGELPEMHCWLEIPFQNMEKDGGVLIDFSAFDIPRVCKVLQGLDWRTPPLPPAIIMPVPWAETPRPRQGGTPEMHLWTYQMSRAATEMVNRIAPQFEMLADDALTLAVQEN